MLTAASLWLCLWCLCCFARHYGLCPSKCAVACNVSAPVTAHCFDCSVPPPPLPLSLHLLLVLLESSPAHLHACTHARLPPPQHSGMNRVARMMSPSKNGKCTCPPPKPTLCRNLTPSQPRGRPGHRPLPMGRCWCPGCRWARPTSSAGCRPTAPPAICASRCVGERGHAGGTSNCLWLTARLVGAVAVCHRCCWTWPYDNVVCRF